MMDFNFSEWWDTLSTIEQIYWGIAIPFTLIFLIQMVLTFIGGELDHDGSVDHDIEMDDGAGFQFFTIRTSGRLTVHTLSPSIKIKT